MYKAFHNTIKELATFCAEPGRASNKIILDMASMSLEEFKEIYPDSLVSVSNAISEFNREVWKSSSCHKNEVNRLEVSLTKLFHPFPKIIPKDRAYSRYLIHLIREGCKKPPKELPDVYDINVWEEIKEDIYNVANKFAPPIFHLYSKEVEEAYAFLKPILMEEEAEDLWLDIENYFATHPNKISTPRLQKNKLEFFRYFVLDDRTFMLLSNPIKERIRVHKRKKEEIIKAINDGVIKPMQSNHMILFGLVQRLHMYPPNVILENFSSIVRTVGLLNEYNPYQYAAMVDEINKSQSTISIDYNPITFSVTEYLLGDRV